MRHSIRTRLIVTIIGLAIGPLLLVGIILALQSFAVQQEQAVALQHEVAAREASQVFDFIQGLEHELEMVINVQGLATLPLEQQKTALSALLLYHNAFNRIFLLDNQGQELVGVSREGIITKEDLGNRAEAIEFIVPMTTGKVYYRAVRTDPKTGEPLMMIAVPVVNLRSGAVDSVLIADFRFKAVQDLITNFETENQSATYMLDANHQVVAHRDPSIALKNIHFSLPSRNGIYPGLGGTQVVLASQEINLGNQTLTVVAERPASDALALAISTVILTTIVVLVVLAIAVVVGFFAVRVIVRPIQSLAATAEAIRMGDFSKRASVTNNDEIGQLGNAFNAMTDAVHKRESDLRNQAEELRVATAKAREAARVKSEFLANISHELRTPLNAIIGFSDMLLMGMTGEITEQQRHKITRLRENGTRLLSLINNVLDLTRIEARRIEIAQKPFAPAALIERLTAQMEILAQKSNLDLKTVVAPDLPATLIGDEPRIEQVVVNLLSNAFKFTEQGAVTLEVGVKRDENVWTLAVTDDGIGIPPHALDLIFEEFRQVDGSSVRAYKGSGLGLAITRNLVRVMDGQINVKSELGKGSTFTVTLPLLEEVPSSAPALETLGV